MRLVGDKAAARQLAVRNGVPVVPGYDGEDQADATLTAEAARIGYPLLVKAAAGGGGRGMRAVHEPSALTEALASARREALAAFGDATLILERLVERPRHVEVQVLGDQHGAVIHLGERDCSVQRRHQKVVEESPAPGLADEVRQALGQAALTIARAADYWNAGTCEFLVDPGGQFWFIEMNARLQVEHPVTELVTGLDLVRHQIEVAAGLPLQLRQEDVRPRGHAVECRLYAEDPARDFVPSTGKVERIRPPEGPGLRHDLGYADGDVLPPYYDAMLGKLIAYGEDRAGAIARARAALDRYVVDGVTTNRQLLGWILDHPAFRAGQATTELLAAEWRPARPEKPTPVMLAAAAAYLLAEPSNAGTTSGGWPGYWGIAGQGIVLMLGPADDPIEPTAVRADAEGQGVWLLALPDGRFRAEVSGARVLIQSLDSQGPRAMCQVTRDDRGLTVQVDGGRAVVDVMPPPAATTLATGAVAGHANRLEAPMPGRVVRVDVRGGDQVDAHQALVVLEAMKIEHVVAAPRPAVVSAVRCTVGDSVLGGQVLIELEPA